MVICVDKCSIAMITSLCNWQEIGLRSYVRAIMEILVLERPEHTRSHPEHEGKDGQQRQYLVGDCLER